MQRLMIMTKEYVLGFSLSPSYIVLIQKLRPAFQMGKLNGLGGLVLPGESSIEAMVREFLEECGRSTEKSDWREFALMLTDRGSVHCFVAHFSDSEQFLARATTDEQIHIVPHERLSEIPHMSNLPWLLRMAK